MKRANRFERSRSLAAGVVLAASAACVGPGPSGFGQLPVLQGDERPGEELWGGWHRMDQVADEELADAWWYARRRSYEEGIGLLDAALARHPGRPSLLEARGALYAGLGYLRAAERDFERAADLTPNEPRLWRGLGRIRLQLGLEARALDALRSARGLGADDQEIHLLFARTFRGLGRIGLAATEFEEALRRPPDPPVAVLLEAASLAASPELPEDRQAFVARARDWLNVVSKRDPDNAQAWFVRGLLDERWNDGDPIAAYRECLARNPEHRGAWTNLALAYHRRRDSIACEEAARKALALERDHARRQALRDLIEAPRVSLRTDDE